MPMKSHLKAVRQSASICAMRTVHWNPCIWLTTSALTMVQRLLHKQLLWTKVWFILIWPITMCKTMAWCSLHSHWHTIRRLCLSRSLEITLDKILLSCSAACLRVNVKTLGSPTLWSIGLMIISRWRIWKQILKRKLIWALTFTFALENKT